MIRRYRHRGAHRRDEARDPWAGAPLFPPFYVELFRSGHS